MLPKPSVEEIEREILEVIKRVAETNPIAGARAVLSQTPYLAQWAHNWSKELWRLELLEQNKMIGIVGRNTSGDFGVLLAPLGQKRLSMPEAEYQRRNQRPSVDNTTTMEFHNSTVGNVAQVVGSHNTTISQTQNTADLQSLTAAIDRLVGAIKKDSTLKPDVKNDAEIEADQLKGELRKSKPNSTFIANVLDSFKALDSAATVLPHVMDLMEKLKAYLPGVL